MRLLLIIFIMRLLLLIFITLLHLLCAVLRQEALPMQLPGFCSRSPWRYLRLLLPEALQRLEAVAEGLREGPARFCMNKFVGRVSGKWALEETDSKPRMGLMDKGIGRGLRSQVRVDPKP
jgi:hypothetical protein